MATDFLNNQININDEVIFTRLGYRELQIGTVTKITDYFVFIDYADSKFGKDSNYITNIKQYHKQVIVKKFFQENNN